MPAEPPQAVHSPDTPRAAGASFVVRLLPGARAAGGWRGQVVHVQSGVAAPFSDAAAMLAFMAEHGAADLRDGHHDPNTRRNSDEEAR